MLCGGSFQGPFQQEILLDGLEQALKLLGRELRFEPLGHTRTRQISQGGGRDEVSLVAPIEEGRGRKMGKAIQG